VRELLLAGGLPVTLSTSEATVDLLIEAIGRDKKRVGASVPFVLLAAPGEVQVGCEVTPAELRAAVEELVR
jgi:3-dehydroquinate synthetase